MPWILFIANERLLFKTDFISKLISSLNKNSSTRKVIEIKKSEIILLLIELQLSSIFNERNH